MITLFLSTAQPVAACTLSTCSEDMSASPGYLSAGSPPPGTAS